MERRSGAAGGAQPYACDICGKQYSNEYHLKCHKVIHGGLNLHEWRDSIMKLRHSATVTGNGAVHSDVSYNFALTSREKTFCQPEQLTLHTSMHAHLPNKSYACKEHYGTPPLSKGRTRAPSPLRPYVCMFCDEAFRYRTELLPHIRRHTGEKAFRCRECGKQFAAMSTLELHMVIHTDVFTKQHSEDAGDATHVCEICGNQYWNEYRLNCHKVIHGGLNLHQWRDSIMKFRHSTTVSGHEAVNSDVNSCTLASCENNLTLPGPMHADTPNRSYTCGRRRKRRHISSPLKPLTQPRSPVRAYVCMFCNKGFRCRTELLRHIRRHTGDKPFRCPECGKQFVAMPTLEQHMVIHTVAFECQHCSRRFANACSLNKHIAVHAGDGPHVCQQCGKVLACAKSLRSHAKYFHSDARPYECADCGRCFKTKYHMKRHRATHAEAQQLGMTTIEELRPYACHCCDRRFREAAVLKRHLMTHTGEKPYLCANCGKSFAHSSCLIGHMRTHTGVKPYSCNSCGRRFTVTTTLTSHIKRVHNGEKPHSCATCGKSFSLKRCLRDHMLTHTGVKPHKCDFCGRRFARSRGLQNHRRTHTGERPYSCVDCGKTFAQSKNLKQHRMYHVSAAVADDVLSGT